jgi:hypothetical protein
MSSKDDAFVKSRGVGATAGFFNVLDFPIFTPYNLIKDN